MTEEERIEKIPRVEFEPQLEAETLRVYFANV